MVCIAAFIIFLAVFPIGMFFPSYRSLMANSWHCVMRRVQLKPCDVSFGDEVKHFIAGMFIFRAPWLAKFILKTAEFWAWVFIFVSVWSIWSVAHSGLNLLVYDTCDPYSGEGCSLSGDSCSIGENRAPIWEPRAYVREGIEYYRETFSLLPSIFRSWNPEEYLVESSTFSGNLESDTIVMEIMDPSCQFCRDQWINLQESEAFTKAKVTYLLYPIPFTDLQGYRFENSYYLSTIIESLKSIDQDKEFLDIFFLSYQEESVRTPRSDVEELISTILREELDLSDSEIQAVQERAESESVQNSLLEQSRIVEEEIITRKIPTLFVGNDRFDRVISEERIDRELP